MACYTLAGMRDRLNRTVELKRQRPGGIESRVVTKRLPIPRLRSDHAPLVQNSDLGDTGQKSRSGRSRHILPGEPRRRWRAATYSKKRAGHWMMSLDCSPPSEPNVSR